MLCCLLTLLKIFCALVISCLNKVVMPYWVFLTDKLVNIKHIYNLHICYVLFQNSHFHYFPLFKIMPWWKTEVEISCFVFGVLRQGLTLQLCWPCTQPRSLGKNSGVQVRMPDCSNVDFFICFLFIEVSMRQLLTCSLPLSNFKR